jgi:toxin ParE1/3/4
MTWKIKLSSDARRDIERALDWTLTNFGQRKREQYLELIRQALEDIAANPAGSRSRTRPELHPNARVYHIGQRGKRARHMFVYINSANEVVEVARLLHDSMDISRHLPEGYHSLDPPTDTG